MPLAFLTFLAAGLLSIQNTMGNPHRVWKEVAAQQIWSEHGTVVTDHLQLRRSPRGRAQLHFWMQRRGTIESQTLEVDRLTIYALAGGIRATAERTAAVIGGRDRGRRTGSYC